MFVGARQDIASDRLLLVIASGDQIDRHSFRVHRVANVNGTATHLAILEVGLVIGTTIQQ